MDGSPGLFPGTVTGDLSVGESADFDTHVRPWFASTGDQPADILNIFGPRTCPGKVGFEEGFGGLRMA
jgi:hypothetical protein